MRQHVSIMISLGSQKNLGLLFHSSQRFTVKYPIPVTLIDCPDITFRFFSLSSPGICAAGSIRTEELCFLGFHFFSNIHFQSPDFLFWTILYWESLINYITVFPQISFFSFQKIPANAESFPYSNLFYSSIQASRKKEISFPYPSRSLGVSR